MLDDESKKGQGFTQSHVVGKNSSGRIFRLTPKHPEKW